MNLYKNEIIEHAQKREENLRVAILAGLAFEDLRKRIIDEFSTILESKLIQDDWSECSLKEWKNYGWVKCRKSHWTKDVYVGLGAISHFSGTEFGVIADTKNVDKKTRENILNVLTNKIGYGKKGEFCAWYFRLEEKEKYANLNSEEGLLALSKFNQQYALNDLYERITTVGKVLDSLFLDKTVAM